MNPADVERPRFLSPFHHRGGVPLEKEEGEKGATEASQQSKVFHKPQTLEIDYHLLSNCSKKR